MKNMYRMESEHVKPLMEIDTRQIGEIFEKSKQEEKTFLCDTCGKSISHQRNFQRHLAEVHGDGVSYECSGCNYTTNRLQNLREHLKTDKHGKVVKKLRQKEIQTAPFRLVPNRPSEKSKEKEKEEKEKEKLTTRKYITNPEDPISYVYQQTLKKNQEPPAWIIHHLESPLKNNWKAPKEVQIIPLHSIEKQIDPRIIASTSSLSIYSETSTLTKMAKKLDKILSPDNKKKDKKSLKRKKQKEEAIKEKKRKYQEEKEKEQQKQAEKEYVTNSNTETEISNNTENPEKTQQVTENTEDDAVLDEIMKHIDIPLMWSPSCFLGELVTPLEFN